ncbi:M23 family metallopeptidase [Collimonas sp. OK412]|jgi:murein DD-endopeptidase MepM/ murein hydrolase activator NlpD|uniref:M23 family metallopeptidase n=1 Tax=Collimonas sp. (strain OK412) TaxID=1801619 RepID=UPI0008DED7D3|nr:M23 family metallopeptidase [Collimonas sp. OK412]SFC56837.1 Peptidase family M23 [Collimonas sp. OK412]
MSLKDKIINLRSRIKPFFKQIPALFTDSSRKTRIVSASAVVLTLIAFGAAGVAPLPTDPDEVSVRAISAELELPSLSEQIAKLEAQQQLYVAEDKMRASDTLAALLTRLGVDDDEASNFIKSDSRARAMLRLKAGTSVQAQTSNDGVLQMLRATLVDGRDDNTPTNLLIQRDGDKFTVTEETAALERRVEMHTGVIRSSLFAATDAADIPDSVASQIVAMFGTNINFASDLKRGDHFNVAYETFWQNGQFLRAGRILAGEFVNGGKPFQAVWFDEPGSGQGGYYGFDGKSLKKAFLKSPLTFTRISSGFSMRVHPILGKWKKHTGVDFAAAAGTPIHATADGVIDFAGVESGYGNVVIIKHDSKYSTVYAHMSRFAPTSRKGGKVSQGDVIGYVGMTGWATGPHLHYEFRVANEPRDPMSVVVPTASPLAGAELERFKTVAADITHRFTLLSGSEAAPLPAAKLASK